MENFSKQTGAALFVLQEIAAPPATSLRRKRGSVSVAAKGDIMGLDELTKSHSRKQRRLKILPCFEAHHEIASGRLVLANGSRYGGRIVTTNGIRCGNCGKWNSKYRDLCWNCKESLAA